MAFCEPNVSRRQFGGEGTGIGLREADEFHRPSGEFGYENPSRRWQAARIRSRTTPGNRNKNGIKPIGLDKYKLNTPLPTPFPKRDTNSFAGPLLEAVARGLPFEYDDRSDFLPFVPEECLL
jgi:hypothetical protein